MICIDHITLIDGYIAFVVIMATLFSIRNNNDNPIGERFIFWGLFPVAIILILFYKIFHWKRSFLWEMIVSACAELYKF